MKVIKFLVILVLIALVGSYFIINYGLEMATRKTLELVPNRAKEFGVLINQIDFEDAWISSYNSISWSNPRAHFQINNDKRVNSSLQFKTQFTSLSVKLNSLAAQDFVISASGIELESEMAPDQTISKSDRRFIDTRLVAGDFQMNFAIDLKSPLRSLRPLMRELVFFARNGETEADIVFQGVMSSTIRRIPIELRVGTHSDGAKTSLKVHRQDLAKTAHLLNLKLTESEIDLLADHPLKSPVLLSIKNYAQSQATKLHDKDNRVSEDAYRHILWSYTLTKEFGEAFAERVTDAHEIGLTGNTAEETKQDYNNNAVGRLYARQGLAESELAAKVISDPRVITEFGRGWNH